MAFNRYKRNKIDTCNICLLTKQLTYDHVPPQGAIDLKPVEIFSILNRLKGEDEDKRGFTSQNGVKFRYICCECNSKIGRRYDIELISFCRTLNRFLKSNLTFPSTVKLKARPVKIIKAIIGHILACKSTIDESVIDKQLRAYVFDDEAKLPEHIHIYYWIYPHEETKIQRDVAKLTYTDTGKEMTLFHILKFFPIAFLITDLGEYSNIKELTKFKGLGLDEEADLTIKLNQRIDQDWPERIEDNDIMFLTDEAGKGIKAIPKK